MDPIIIYTTIDTKYNANKLAKNSSPEEVTALITGAIETA